MVLFGGTGVASDGFCLEQRLSLLCEGGNGVDPEPSLFLIGFSLKRTSIKWVEKNSPSNSDPELFLQTNQDPECGILKEL